MCFSMEWLESLLIWLIVVGIVIGLLKLIIPPVLALLGVGGGIIIQAINLVVYGIILIIAVIFVFGLIRCVGHFPI